MVHSRRSHEFVMEMAGVGDTSDPWLATVSLSSRNLAQLSLFKNDFWHLGWAIAPLPPLVTPVWCARLSSRQLVRRRGKADMTECVFVSVRRLRKCHVLVVYFWCRRAVIARLSSWCGSNMYVSACQLIVLVVVRSGMPLPVASSWTPFPLGDAVLWAYPSE